MSKNITIRNRNFKRTARKCEDSVAFPQTIEKIRWLFCISLQTDAFRGPGFSLLVASAPAGPSAQVALSLCSITAPAGVAAFRFIQRYFLLVSYFFYSRTLKIHFCTFFPVLQIWSKTAETPAGKRDSRDPARREATEEAWRSPAASVAVLRNIGSIRKSIYLSRQIQEIRCQ